MHTFTLKSLLDPKGHHYWEDEAKIAFIQTPGSKSQSDKISIMLESAITEDQILLQRYEYVEDPAYPNNFRIDIQEEKINPNKPYESTLLHWNDKSFLLDSGTINRKTAVLLHNNIQNSSKFLGCYKTKNADIEYCSSGPSKKTEPFLLENNKSFQWARDLFFSVTKKDWEYRKLVHNMFRHPEPLNKFVSSIDNTSDPQIQQLLKNFKDSIDHMKIIEGEENISLKLKALHQILVQEQQSKLLPDNNDLESFVITKFTNFTKNLDNMPEELKNVKQLSESQKTTRKAILHHRAQSLANDIQNKLEQQKSLAPVSSTLKSAIFAVVGAIIGAAIGSVATFWMGGLGAGLGAAIGTGIGSGIGGAFGFFHQKKQTAAFGRTLKPLQKGLDTAHALEEDCQPKIILKK